MNLFGSLFAGIEYDRKLRIIREERKPAEDTGADHCCNSGVCCWRRPPALTQEDLSRLARSKGMTESGFFLEFCVVDKPGTATIAPTLRRADQKRYAGKYLPTEETFSISTPCVFHKDNSCSVHDIKPSACAAFKCWSNNSDIPNFSWTSEELIALGWDGKYYDDEEDLL